MREQAGMLVEMVQQNTALTERVETLLKQNRIDPDRPDPGRKDRCR